MSEQRERWQELNEAAIDGPWECVYTDYDVSIRPTGDDPGFYTEVAQSSQWPDDMETSPTAEFIAAARTAWPAAERECEQLRALLREVRELEAKPYTTEGELRWGLRKLLDDGLVDGGQR